MAPPKRSLGVDGSLTPAILLCPPWVVFFLAFKGLTYEVGVSYSVEKIKNKFAENLNKK
jgi:hypothetical protein